MKKEIISLKDSQKYLNKILAKLKQEQDYNILVHQISPFYSNYNNSNLFEEEIYSILKQGLHISKYSSIFGTLALLGEINSDTSNKILDYSFCHDFSPKAILIVAIPKYVVVNGNKMEFSSYNGISSRDKSVPLINEYKKAGVIPTAHHFKRCLFDAIKGYSELPTYYNVGAIIIDENNNTCTFYDEQTHINYFNQENKQNFNQLIEKKVNILFDEYKTKSLDEAIVKSYLKEQAWRDEEILFDL